MPVFKAWACSEYFLRLRYKSWEVSGYSPCSPPHPYIDASPTMTEAIAAFSGFRIITRQDHGQWVSLVIAIPRGLGLGPSERHNPLAGKDERSGGYLCLTALRGLRSGRSSRALSFTCAKGDYCYN